jgi:hypothetical protein
VKKVPAESLPPTPTQMTIQPATLPLPAGPAAPAGRSNVTPSCETGKTRKVAVIADSVGDDADFAASARIDETIARPNDSYVCTDRCKFVQMSSCHFAHVIRSLGFLCHLSSPLWIDGWYQYRCIFVQALPKGEPIRAGQINIGTANGVLAAQLSVLDRPRGPRRRSQFGSVDT